MNRIFGMINLNKTTLEKDKYIVYSDCSIYNSGELLNLYIQFGTDIVHKLNCGFAFAIFDTEKQELFLCRDHFGIKPLFYSLINDIFIFSSEIKGILENVSMERTIDASGICELFGLGPARTPGNGIFNNVHELKPAHFLIYNKSGIKTKEFWKLESTEHTDDFETTCDKVRYLLTDSIQKQSVGKKPICSFLSGGLDSSIISASMSRFIPNLHTFSVDYIDNDKNFVKSDFQPNSDKYYIDLFTSKFNTKHETIFVDTPELADYLEDAMISRDFPGMADVDSSLLIFCKKVKEKFGIALSR